MNKLELLKNKGYEFRQKEGTQTGTGCIVPFLECKYKDNNGKWITLPQSQDIIHFLCGEHHPQDEETQKKMIENREILAVESVEIYKDYYNLDEAAICRMLHYCSLRTWKYLQSTMQGIGLEKHTSAVDGSRGEEGKLLLSSTDNEYSIFANAETRIGKVNGKWLVETCHQYSIDDFAIIKMWFSHKPTYSEIKTAFAIRSVEEKLMNASWQPHSENEDIEEFTCWECGRKIHWLDSSATGIQEKLNFWNEKYCGC